MEESNKITNWDKIFFIFMLLLTLLFSALGLTYYNGSLKSIPSAILMPLPLACILLIYVNEMLKASRPPKFKTKLEIEEYELKQKRENELVQYVRAIFPELRNEPFIKQSLKCRIGYHETIFFKKVEVCIRCGALFVFPHKLGFSDPNIRLMEREEMQKVG